MYPEAFHAEPPPVVERLPCEREPIHTPGAIQPHGAVLAVPVGSGVVSHASANVQAILGRSCEEVLGQPLQRALGEAASAALSNSVPDDRHGLDHVHVMPGPDGRMLYLRAHRSGSHLCIDIEPLQLDASQGLHIVEAQSVVQSFRAAASTEELCELAVRGLKAVTGFERVMAYRFGEDGHGEVIAEAREARLAPYLGLRYPASDIPAQARRQYLNQRVGAIADSAYGPVPLLADRARHDGVPFDLTRSALRSVSPVHRAYMRNMKTAASLTVGLAQGSELWGMLVCHHGTPRVAGPKLRAAAGMIGEVVSLLLASLAETDIDIQRRARGAVLRRLVDGLAAALPLPQAVAAAETDLLALVGASGAIVRMAGAHLLLGRTPPLPLATQALEVLRAEARGDTLALDDVGLRFAQLASCATHGSGALLMQLESGAEDAILWFRPEVARTVSWGGDPAQHTSVDAVSGHLTPRTSFAAWKETVRGRSAAWSHADRALAGEFRDAVKAEVAHRTRVALRDSESRFLLLAEHSGVVVTLNDMDGTRRYVSPSAESVLGWHPEALIGREPMELVHPDDRQAQRDAQTALQRGMVERSACYRHMRPDGSWLWIEAHSRVRSGADGAAATDYVVVMRDATQRKAAELELMEVLERMESMAASDGLTGLANRRRFDEAAGSEWRRCERDRLPLSLLLLDADHFKRYNDCYGHVAGDACLRAIASQLEAAVQRPGDLAVRYGGEEFLLLLPNTGREGALRVAQRVRGLVQGLGIAHRANEAIGLVTVSIGAATAWPGAPDGGPGNVDALLRAADAALYRAKREGRNRVEALVYGQGQSEPPAEVAPIAVRGEALHAETPLPNEPGGAHEALMQFLYRAPIGLAQTTLDGTVEMINPMAASLLIPLSSNGDLDNLFDVLEGVAPQLRALASDYQAHSGALCESIRITLPEGADDGSVQRVLSISLLKLDETRLMAMVSDVTLEVERELSGLSRRLDAAARTDSVTQMPNRAALRDLIQRAIVRERTEGGHEFAVLFMNCDRFKQVNDSLGPAAGDEVLGLMADRLRSALRQRDRGGRNAGSEPKAGRLGGDEFVVLLDDLQSPDEVHAVAQRLLDVLSQPYGVRTHQVHLSVSIGVVQRAHITADADTVLRDASIAMVEAKRAGGARHVVFEPWMRVRASRRGEVEMDLRRALLEDQLFVVYQPVVTLRASPDDSHAPAHAAGVEALVRWRHPTRGVVPPVEFIGVAEECGLIGALGEFVLTTACRQFAEWHRCLGRLAPRLLAVNLSRGQLADPGLACAVSRILQGSGMLHAQLQLEVTESLAAQDESVRSRLQELRELGLTLALDDFGTGYSSLSSLHQLPVGTVKIDRSFVSEAVVSTHHRVLIEATVRVANSLGMGTVAEGIETAAQAALLRQLGCDKGQGYFFSPPLATADLVSWLTKEDTLPRR